MSSFDVYVGNLSVMTSTKQLHELFGQLGKILFVWKKECYQKYTYAFVAFCNLPDAKRACQVFNNQNVDGFNIKVTLSTKTEQIISGSVKIKTNEPSVLLELPKKTGKKEETKEDIVRKILKQNLQNEGEDFVCLFKKALKEMDEIEEVNPFLIKPAEIEKPSIETLEGIVVRYYEKCKPKACLFKKIDFDLTKGF